MNSKKYVFITMSILLVSLFLLISDLFNWGLFQSLSTSNDWLGYFGSLISSMLALFVFFETIREERQNRREEENRRYEERIISARPIFFVKNANDEQLSIELFVKDGTPLRNVTISGRFKHGRPFEEVLNIKAGEGKRFSKDVEYLQIKSISSMNEENHYSYNSKEKREYNYPSSERKSLLYLYRKPDLTCFELVYIIKEVKWSHRMGERLIHSEYSWILELINQDSELQQLKQHVALLERQLPLDRDIIRWKYKILADTKIFHSLRDIEAIIYGNESNYRLLIIIKELQKFLEDKPVRELNNLSAAFIWEFNSQIKRFLKGKSCNFNKASELLVFDNLLNFIEILCTSIEKESEEQYVSENKEMVRLALYALSNHYELQSCQKENYEQFIIQLLNKLY